ncbi:hypothetical protein BDY24DRAFT_351580 [Mrakia frigida]|uniref:uncharacterized protein n=1 Tax=Mrakia frigida TaxID=29902 RepID=UPI003FCC200D
MSSDPKYLLKEEEVAVQAVLLACSLTLKVFHRLVKGDVQIKDDKTPVTVADLASQAIISRLLLQAFPFDPLVGEEDSDDLRLPSSALLRERVTSLVTETLTEAKLPVGEGQEWEETLLEAIDRGGKFEGGMGRFWTCDPIDGTKGFVRGDQFAVCLALIEGGKTILSVIGCPNMLVDPTDEKGPKGVVFVARKGHGAYMHPTTLPHTRTTLRIRSLGPDTPLLESYDPHHSDQALSARAAELLGITVPPMQIDSQAKYCELCRGGGGLFFRVRLPRGKVFEEKIWDHAPGSLLVTESGGCISTLEGEEITFGTGRVFRSTGIFASHRWSHEKVLKMVRAASEAE